MINIKIKISERFAEFLETYPNAGHMVFCQIPPKRNRDAELASPTESQQPYKRLD